MALLLVFLSGLLAIGNGLELTNGAYEGLVIKVAENVPQDDCTKILKNLEVSISNV